MIGIGMVMQRNWLKRVLSSDVCQINSSFSCSFKVSSLLIVKASSLLILLHSLTPPVLWGIVAQSSRKTAMGIILAPITGAGSSGAISTSALLETHC